MKKSSYWLAGALAVVLAVLGVAAVVRRPDAAPRVASAPPPEVLDPADRSAPPSSTPLPKPAAPPPTQPTAYDSPVPTQHHRAPRPGESPDPTATADLPLPPDTASAVSPSPAPRSSATPAVSAPATAADPLASVDATLKKMDWGQMAFDVPERLRKDETALIHLIVSPNATVEQLTATLRAEATGPVRIEPAQIQISDLMEARLVGSAFDIQSITPEEPQMVGRAQPTEWKWEIHPRQPGHQSLHLTVNAIVRYRGEKIARAVRTFDRVIEVEVAAAPSFFERSRPWLFSIIGLVALANGLLIFRRRGRRPGALPTPAAATLAPADGVDLFVSYSRRDEERALALAGRLQAVGYKVWIDQRGIDGATLWAQEISEAIRRCKACVLFASAASLGSANVARELSLVCEEGKPILPLFLEAVEVPSTLRFQLAGIQQIELHRGEAEENFQRVLRALDRLGVARPVTTDAR